MKNIRLQAAARKLFILVPLLAGFVCIQGMMHGEKAVPASPSNAVADVFERFQDPRTGRSLQA